MKHCLKFRAVDPVLGCAPSHVIDHERYAQLKKTIGQTRIGLSTGRHLNVPVSLGAAFSKDLEILQADAATHDIKDTNTPNAGIPEDGNLLVGDGGIYHGHAAQPVRILPEGLQ